MEKVKKTQTEPYAVLREFDVETEYLQEFTDVLKELQTNALQENGCYAFEILQSKENPETLYLYECFENIAAHISHMESSYYRELVFDKPNPMLRGKKITKVQAI